MADEWVDVNPQQSEWQDVTHPSGANIGDLAFDTYARAGMGAYDAMKWIPGVKQLANIVPGTNADQLSQNLQSNANLGQKVVQGTGQGLAMLPQVLPFVKAAGAIPMIGKMAGGAVAPIAGMAGYGATKSIAEGNPVGQGALEGAGQGLAYSAGGALGSKLGQMAFNPIARAVGGQMGGQIAKVAPAVGTAVGSGGTAALMAPEGEKVNQGIVGTALGGLNPIGQKTYEETLQDATDAHQKMLNVGKGVIQKVEMKSGKDLQDSYRLAAQHGLTYDKFEGNKTDTTNAQAQLQPIMSILHNQADAIVKSDPHKLFDLKQLGDEAKLELKNDPKFKNDLAYNAAKDQIDAHVKAAIDNRGRFVDAPTLNTMKQGMWNASFEPLQPNNNAVARQLGNTAKSSLEDAFQGSGLGDVNSRLGKYLDLKALLINAHGNTVPNGKLGKGWAGGIGAGTGIAMSHFAPNPEIAGLMTLGGTKAGMMLNEHLNDPGVISRSVADKIKLSQMANGIDVMPKFSPVQQTQYQNMPVNNQIALPGNSPLRLGFNPISEYIQARHGEPIITPPPHTATGFPINQPSVPGALGLPNYGPPIRPMNIPTGEAISHNPIPLPGISRSAFEPINIPPKTSADNGPLQPNQRAQFDMSKSGNAMVPKSENVPVDNKNIENSKNILKGKFNPLANTVNPQQLPPGVKALGLAGAIAVGSMLNPMNAQAAQNVKEPERLQLPGNEYTKKEEGFQAHPYIDTKGNKTIGYGFKMDAVAKYLPRLVLEGKRPLTKQEADQIYTKLYANARNSAQSFSGDSWHNLNGQQQKSLIDMSYNMGGKLNGFKNMKQAIEDGDYQRASSEIMNSNYAKEVPNRAKRNSALMGMK